MLNFSKSALWGATALIALCCVTPASAQSIAGPKPTTVPGTQTCDVQGQVVVTGIGSPSVANGLLGANGLWTIFSVNEGTTPICSFPTAANAQVDCIANGRVVDPSNCTVADYAALQSRNLVPVSPGGVAPSDIRFANWVQPGFEVGGCNADWVAVQGAEPNACGDVVVPVTVSCQTTNSQSGTVPSNFLTCNPNTRPNDDVTLTNFRSCSFSMASDEFGEDSDICGTITRSKSVYCERADENATRFDFSSPECTTLVSDFCANLPVGQVCDSQTNNVLTVVESREGPVCAVNTGFGQFSWFAGDFSEPSATCGESIVTRDVFCQDNLGVRSGDELCINAGPRPASSETITSFAGCTAPRACSGGRLLFTNTLATNGIDTPLFITNPFGGFVSNTLPDGTVLTFPANGQIFSDGSFRNCTSIGSISSPGLGSSVTGGLTNTSCTSPCTCIEDITRVSENGGNTRTELLQNCYGSAGEGDIARVSPVNLNGGSFILNGLNFTFGSDGWCNYSSNSIDRTCLNGSSERFGIFNGNLPPLFGPSCEVRPNTLEENNTFNEIVSGCLGENSNITISKAVEFGTGITNPSILLCGNVTENTSCNFSDFNDNLNFRIVPNSSEACTASLNECTRFPISPNSAHSQVDRTILPNNPIPGTQSCVDSCNVTRSHNERFCQFTGNDPVFTTNARFFTCNNNVIDIDSAARCTVAVSPSNPTGCPGG